LNNNLMVVKVRDVQNSMKDMDQSSLCPVGAIHELPLQFLKNYLPMTISQNDNRWLILKLCLGK